MKTDLKLRTASFLLIVLALLTVFGVVCSASEPAENDPTVTLTTSLSHAGNGETSVVGSGELHSTVLKTTINFYAESSDNLVRVHLRLTHGGSTTTVKDAYYSWVCSAEDDYGTIKVEILNSSDVVVSVYQVEIVYDGEDGFWTRAFKEFKDEFTNNFINDDRYKLLLQGLGNTMIITLCALMMGIVIGTLVAAVRSTYDKNVESYRLYGGFFGKFMSVLNSICKIYLTIIRGTPVVVQLLIMYFIIFAGSKSDLTVAIVAFGINSGAYVAEILRGGIMSVDAGQFEAGRSLGFNYFQTMIHIIIPQMFKSSLPALCNEFISLLKETSVAGYVPIVELTKAGDIIRGRTYSAFMPLIAVALIYLTIVIILTKLVGLLERRLRKNER